MFKFIFMLLVSIVLAVVRFFFRAFVIFFSNLFSDHASATGTLVKKPVRRG